MIVYKQVCNPSIQFMIYESLLKHVTAKRAADKRGLKTVSSGKVFYIFCLIGVAGVNQTDSIVCGKPILLRVSSTLFY